jgi:hypothetical protein
VKIKPLRQLNSICSILYSIHTRIEIFDSYTPKRKRETRTQEIPYFENRANAVARVQIMQCGVAQIGCAVAQIVARLLALRQARVRISFRHPRGGPLPSGCYEENKSGTRRVVDIKILYACSIYGK